MGNLTTEMPRVKYSFLMSQLTSLERSVFVGFEFPSSFLESSNYEFSDCLTIGVLDRYSLNVKISNLES